MHYRSLLLLSCLLGSNALHAEKAWLEGDYLLWTTKKAPLPIPLVTSASLADPLPGALGQPGTKVLLGDKNVDMHWQSGFRLALGGWIDRDHHYGLEGSFFMLPKKFRQQSLHTSGEPGSKNVAVPVYDVTGLWGLSGVPGETIFILPGPLMGPGFKGRFSLKTTNKLLGFELNTLVNLESEWVDLIGGFRWLQLEESVAFIGRTAGLPDSPFAGGFYNFKDRFKTDNNFYGLQVGLKAHYHLNRWMFNGFAKMAIGCMNEKGNIKGRSQTSGGNLFYMTKDTGDEILRGGVFAEPTNHGSHHHNAFGVVLETGVNFGYRFSKHLELDAGWDLLWVNSVLRPGKQIDRKVNPTRTALAEASRDSAGIGPDAPVPFGDSAAAPLPTGPRRPQSKRVDTDFWAQGLTVNLILKF